MKSLVLSVLLVLCGCASAGRWVQAGKTDAEMHRDLADAQMEAEQIGPDPALLGMIPSNEVTKRRSNFIKNRMQGKGWEWSESAPNVPSTSEVPQLQHSRSNASSVIPNACL